MDGHADGLGVAISCWADGGGSLWYLGAPACTGGQAAVPAANADVSVLRGGDGVCLGAA